MKQLIPVIVAGVLVLAALTVGFCPKFNIKDVKKIDSKACVCCHLEKCEDGCKCCCTDEADCCSDDKNCVNDCKTCECKKPAC